MKKLMALMLVFSLISTGCATVFKGGAEPVEFSSNPPGAEVYVDGLQRGTTPVSVPLESNKTHNVEFRKPGYTTQTSSLSNGVDGGWIVLDVVPGFLLGFIPLIVDAITSDWNKLNQKNMNADLQASNSSNLEGGENFNSYFSYGVKLTKEDRWQDSLKYFNAAVQTAQTDDQRNSAEKWIQYVNKKLNITTLPLPPSQ